MSDGLERCPRRQLSETRGDQLACSTTACARTELKTAELTASPTERVGRRYNWLLVHSNRICEKSARPHQANPWETTALARERQHAFVGAPTGTQRLRVLIDPGVRPRDTYIDHHSPFLGASKSSHRSFLSPQQPAPLSDVKADRAREQRPLYPVGPLSKMEQAHLIDSALIVVFCDNDIENGRHPELFRALFTFRDLALAFATVEAHASSALDISLERTVHNLARRDVSATCELVEIAKAVNRLRQSSGVEYLIPDEVLEHMKRTIQTLAGHKRKYDELLDQKEREARQRAEAKRVTQMFGREERARRRDGLKQLESKLEERTQELVTAQRLLRRAQMDAKSLKWSLECQICWEESWDTVTGCGHLFGADCIKQWLEAPNWVEDDEGCWVLQEPRCPVCRVTLSEGDLERVYV